MPTNSVPPTPENPNYDYVINMNTIRMLDNFPGHLSIKGADRYSKWNKYLNGKVFEVQIPPNATSRGGKPMWYSLIGTIRQAAQFYAKRTWPDTVKTVHIAHQYDAENSRLYFQVTFKDKKVNLVDSATGDPIVLS